MSSSSELSPLGQALSGSVGAVISNALIYPLDTIVTRLQTSKRKSGKAANTLPEAIRGLLKEGGIAAFYRGLASDSISTALSNFLYFLSYTFLRDTLINRKLKISPPTPKKGGKGVPPPVLSALEEILVGCLAGVVAKGVVSPLSNITVRQQTATAKKAEVEGAKGDEKGQVEVTKNDDDSSDDEDRDYHAPSILDIARDIFEEKGWTGFWSGFKSSIILTTNPAITFYLFELFKRALIPVKHQEHPTPGQTFITSATASSCASIITYPLILSKTRLQFKSPSGRRLYKSNYDVFTKTIKKYGVQGMYAGLEGQIVKGFLSEGVKMTLKERVEILFLIVHRSVAQQQRKVVT